MKFSIIVPIYNVERYVAQCLLSLWNQNYAKNEYEIIVIDDCSPDGSLNIVESLYPIISNLRVIRHFENRHQGGGRNTGIKEAQGEWIFFVDSDDYWIYTDVLITFDKVIAHSFLPVIRSTSFVNTDVNTEFSICQNKDSNQATTYKVTKSSDYFLSDKFFYNVWTSCYKRDFLLSKAIWFREHVAYEDSDWTIKMLWSTAEVVIINYPFYAYRANPESITTKPSLKSFKDNATSVKRIYEFACSLPYDKNFNAGIYKQIKKSILSFIRISRKYHPAESVQVLKSLPADLLSSISDNTKTVFIEKVMIYMIKKHPTLLCKGVKILVKIKRKFRCH